MIEAFIDCRPPTATAQHKGARILRKKGTRKHTLVFFESGDVEEARIKLTEHFTRHAPPAPLAGPLKLTVTWTFYWNQVEEKRRRKGQLPAWVPKITRPDGDNLAKMVKDVMTKLGFWKDDAHVSAEYYRRGVGDRPGIHIRIEPYVIDYEPPED